MIHILQLQLHFVRDIQSVDVSGFEPLRSIRDETGDGLKEATIGVEQLGPALAGETLSGYNKRPKRQKQLKVDTVGVESWDTLEAASQIAGRYFVVRSGKSK